MASAKKFLFDTDFRGNSRKAVDEGALDAARAELAAEPEFDHTVVNHEVNAAAAELVSLLTWAG